MKILFYKYCIVLIGILLLSGCSKNFEDINTDPNNPSQVATSQLLVYAQRDMLGLRTGTASTSNFSLTEAVLLCQHFSQKQYTETSRYSSPQASFNWMYTRSMVSLKEIIRLNNDEDSKARIVQYGDHDNQIAVARILLAYNYQILTDTWGDIPYSEALDVYKTRTPKYDKQSEIYKDLIKELKEASNQIKVDKLGVAGDIIYGGNMLKWKKFANSILLRVGMRLSKVDPKLAKETINDAISGGVFESNDDQALFKHLSDADNDNPLYQHFITRADYCISNTMVDYLKETKDPRLFVYANPREFDGTYVGMPYGLSQKEAGSIGDNMVSFPGDLTRKATTPTMILSYSETLFLKSEAAARGWISEDAETLYKEAITANLTFWGIEATKIEEFLNEESIKYDNSNFEKSIGNQKWVSLYMQGIEGWCEWRRLGYPKLKPAPDAVEGRQIPRRKAYVQTEYDINGKNVQIANKRQGPDNMDTRVWWDVK